MKSSVSSNTWQIPFHTLNICFIESRDGKSTFQVTHAYGHGGFGYQTSWGSAKYAIQIMEEGITSANKKMSSRL